MGNINLEKLKAFAIPGLLLVLFLVTFLFGRQIFGFNEQGDIEALIGTVRSSYWAPLVVLAVFTIVGLTGFPQFMLMAAAVVIFGPFIGFLYSWLATVFSASVGFWVGHFMGNQVLRKFAGDRLNRISQAVGDQGIMASILVRMVPTAPFAVVNLVLGASHVSFTQYFLGSLIGVIPKAALVAYVGHSFFDFISGGNPLDLLILALVLGVWVLTGIWLQRVIKASRAKSGGAEEASSEEDVAPLMAVEERAAPSDEEAEGPQESPKQSQKQGENQPSARLEKPLEEQQISG